MMLKHSAMILPTEVYLTLSAPFVAEISDAYFFQEFDCSAHFCRNDKIAQSVVVSKEISKLSVQYAFVHLNIGYTEELPGYFSFELRQPRI